MMRKTIDEEPMKLAMGAVRNEGETIRSAALKFGLNRSSLSARLTGKVAVAARSGPHTVLIRDEEPAIEDMLIYAGSHYLGVTKQQLQEDVHKLCSDGRPVPWDPTPGPGHKWVTSIFKRHPRLSLRSSRIYEVNRVTTDDQDGMEMFYSTLGDYMKSKAPAPDHIMEHRQVR